MPEKNPLEFILNEMANLLQLVYKNIQNLSQKPVAEAIYTQMEKLRQDVDQFCKMNEELLAQQGVTEKESKEAITKIPEDLQKKEKHLLERMEKMKQELLNFQTSLTAGIEAAKKGEALQKKGAARKKKFKSLGSDKDWLRM